MNTKLPPLSETIEFLEKAEEIADGKRQSKYVAGVVGEFAHYVNSADLLAKNCISIPKLKKFLEQKRAEASEEAKVTVSPHQEGCYEAYDFVLQFIEGEANKE